MRKKQTRRKNNFRHRAGLASPAPCQTLCSSVANDVPLKSTITMPKTKSNHQAALLAIEKVLTLLRSVQTLEGTDKDGVEHLLEMAVENLREP